MDSAAPSSSRLLAGWSGARSRATYLAVTIGVLAFVGVVAWYTLDVLRANTFQRERAFRALGEVAEQFQNLQKSMVGLLIPENLQRCNPSEAACARERTRFSRKLTVALKLEATQVERAVVAKQCATQPDKQIFLLDVEEPSARFELLSCVEARQRLGESQAADPQVRLNSALKGDMAQAAESFVSQSFFDEVVLAVDSGRVLAELPRVEDARGVDRDPLHDPKIRRLSVVDAARLLRRAESEVQGGKSEDGKARAADAAAHSLHPVVFTERIAGQNYHVFVGTFRPAYATLTREGGTSQNNLYVIGLKRVDLRADVVDLLGPGGTFAVSIFIALTFFAFPLVSLKLKARQDAISWGEAAACVLALFFVTAIATVMSVWFWKYHELLDWADDAAESYAASLSDVLSGELHQDALLLSRYRDRFFEEQLKPLSGAKSGCDNIERAWYQAQAPLTLPLRISTASSATDTGSQCACDQGISPDGPARQRLGNGNENDCDGMLTMRLLPQSRPQPACEEQCGLKAWSPLRSNFATDALGTVKGPRVSAYAVVPVKQNIDLADREYYTALARGWHWQFDDPDTSVKVEYIAQRLFNRGDGARILQVAAPRSTNEGAFSGIVSGDSRVHSLTAPIAPLFLRFAVIDRNGAVLFHWDDSRSLTENFFVEADSNTELQAAVALRRVATFAGDYNGQPHRFSYVPMPDIAPWGVVVFYPTGVLSELPSQAGINALVSYASIVLFIALLLFVAGAVLGRERVESALAGLWPCREACRVYAALASALIVVALGSMWALLPERPGAVWSPQIVMLLLGALFLAVASYRSRQSYAACILAIVLVFAALPAGWLALTYHDMQVVALLREGMANSIEDVKRRHAIIDRDLRRWDPNPENRSEWLPPSWVLAEHPTAIPVAGFRFAPKEQQWQMTAFATPPSSAATVGEPVDRWRRLVWRLTSSSDAQRRRLELFNDRGNDSRIWQARSPDGHLLKLASVWRAPSQRDAPDWSPLGNLAVGLSTLLIAAALSVFISRRLLGADVDWPSGPSGDYAHPPTGDPDATVIFFHPPQRPGENERVDLASVVTRIDRHNTISLPTDPRVVGDPAAFTPAGACMLQDLDLAIATPERRRGVLALLERLLDSEKVSLIVTCRRSPLQWLHHPEAYPEAGEERPDYAELVRWDNVLARFACIRNYVARPWSDDRSPVSQSESPLTIPAVVRYHAMWKLCTRAERLALYHLAQGHLANPMNKGVLDPLIRHGLVKVDPRPRTADPGFRRFVRTAETSADIARWQVEATHTPWRGMRRPVLGGLLMLVLALAIWFSWAGGETFKVFTTVIVAAVGLLGPLSNALSFVRNAGAAQRS